MIRWIEEVQGTMTDFEDERFVKTLDAPRLAVNCLEEIEKTETTAGFAADALAKIERMVKD